MLVLAGCAPNTNLASPVGAWETTGDDNGTLTINADGTFTITDASYNFIQDRDANNNFNGSGTWQAFSDPAELILKFAEASQGNSHVEPSSRGADFTSGTIRFFDAEETASIEFRLIEAEPTPLHHSVTGHRVTWREMLSSAAYAPVQVMVTV